MLRASGEGSDTEVDLGQVVGSKSGGPTIPHADELVSFVEASVSGEPDALDEARSALEAVTDGATVVDAAAVVANFEMMTRIADGTGTTHPDMRLEQFDDLTDQLGLNDYRSARRL